MKTSMIIISYNQEKYIIDTLNGIISQSIIPDEVIIADDNSTDNTQNLILNFIKKNNLYHWKTIFNQENVGISKNLNNALRKATGDILMLNAGDDISLPNRVEDTINAFKQNPDALIVTGHLDVINAFGNEIGEIKNNPEICNDIKRTIKNGMPFIHPVGQGLHKNIFSKFGLLPTDVPNEDDQLSFWGIISGGIYIIPKKLMKYRIHSSSASSWIRDKDNAEKFYQRFISDMPIRKRHMELWVNALNKTGYKNNKLYHKILHNKIEMYDYFGQLGNHQLFSRIIFTLKHLPYLNFKEIYYSLLGKYGIISWKYIRNIIKG